MRQDEPGVEAPIHQAADDVMTGVKDYLKSWEVHTTMSDVDKVICALKYSLQEVSLASSISEEELLHAVGSGQSASSLTISPPTPGGHSFTHPTFESILGDFLRAPIK